MLKNIEKDKFKKRENIILKLWTNAPTEIISLVVSYCDFPIDLIKIFQQKYPAKGIEIIPVINILTYLPHTTNNDTRIVSASDDKNLRVWNIDSGKCLQVLKGHSYYVKCVTIMPNGLIVSGSYDKNIRVWNADSGECLQVLKDHTDVVYCVAIIPDGRIVSGSYDKTLRVWNADSGKCLQVLNGHSDYVECVAIMPDGRIVSGSYDKTLRVWNADSGECLQVLEGHSYPVNCVSIMPDGRIVSGSSDETLRIWNADSGKECLQHKSDVETSYFKHIPDTTLIVCNNKNRTQIEVYDINGIEKRRVIEDFISYDHLMGIMCKEVIPDGRIITTTPSGVLKVWGET